jgi:hypothetical protein
MPYAPQMRCQATSLQQDYTEIVQNTCNLSKFDYTCIISSIMASKAYAPLRTVRLVWIATMTKRHHYLPLSKVTPGMVLAEDLLERMGHVLLPAGAALTAGMLKSLAQHDVHLLAIVATEDMAADSANDTTQQLERIEHLFRHVPRPEPTATLYEYVRNYRMTEAP